MSSISFQTIDLKRAAWRAKRVVAATAIELSSFRFPGSPDVLPHAEGESQGVLRVRVDRVLRGDGVEGGSELRVFSSLQWFRHTDKVPLQAGVISYVEEHYRGGIPVDEIRPGERILLFLDDQPAPAGFPPGSVFMSFEGAVDRGSREPELEAALKDGPYGDFHHLLKIPDGGRMRLPDDLVISFLGHSHKRPMIGGPRKEWVTLRLALGGVEETLDLAHCSDPDGRETWDHKEWKGYKIEAHGMTTSEATIVVRKL